MPDVPDDAEITVTWEHYASLQASDRRREKKLQTIAQAHEMLGQFLKNVREAFGSEFTTMVGQFNDMDHPMTIHLNEDGSVSIEVTQDG